MDDPLKDIHLPHGHGHGKDKQIIYGAIGLVTLYLLYRWYSSRGGAGATSSGGGASTPASDGDTGASDYASEAGQEQSDVAALQGQNSTLAGQQTADEAQEAADVNGLGTQEQNDFNTLSGLVAGLTATVDGLTQDVASGGSSGGSAQDPSGKQPPRSAHGTPAANDMPGKGVNSSAFSKYYQRVTGHKEPANVRAGNYVFQEFKHGTTVKTARTQKLGALHNHAGNHAPKPHMPVAGKAVSGPAAKAVQAKNTPKPKPPPKPAPKSQAHKGKK
jgi:hypothetical protein